jgi:hypothetical protein
VIVDCSRQDVSEGDHPLPIFSRSGGTCSGENFRIGGYLYLATAEEAAIPARNLESMRLSTWIAFLSLGAAKCSSFYVPGWSPHSYRVGDTVPLFLNKVSSERTHLPYAYSELPGVCKPSTAQRVSLNLGEILRGMSLIPILTFFRRPHFPF